MTKAELIYAITGDVERYLQAIKDDKANHSPDVGKMAECEHEWKRYSLGRLGQRTENHRYCLKCGADEIEPTDNTKIEELDPDNYNLDNLSLIVTDTFKKLNEVIRHINKGE